MNTSMTEKMLEIGLSAEAFEAAIEELIDKIEETDEKSSISKNPRGSHETGRAKRRSQKERAKKKIQRTLKEQGFMDPEHRWWVKSQHFCKRYDLLERQHVTDRWKKREDNEIRARYLGTVDFEEPELEGCVSAVYEDDYDVAGRDKELLMECYNECFEAFLANPVQFLEHAVNYATDETIDLLYYFGQFMDATAKALLEKKKVMKKS